MSVSGSRELEFWGASLRERKEGGLYAAPTKAAITEAVEADIEFAKAKYGARSQRDPTALPAALLRFLAVESAFTLLAVRGADALYGSWYSLDAEGRKNWERFVGISRGRLRGLCSWVYRDRRRLTEWKDDEHFAMMALYGVTRQSRAKWLAERLRDVREQIEAADGGCRRDFDKKSQAV